MDMGMLLFLYYSTYKSYTPVSHPENAQIVWVDTQATGGVEGTITLMRSE